jgi:D-alanyl-D-alanine carboxypeptidase
LAPFVPLWFYGDIAQSFSTTPGTCSEQAAVCPLSASASGIVAGETTQKSNGDGGYSYGLFPAGASTAPAGIFPTRKSGVPDLRLWAGSSVAIDVDSGTILHYDNGKKRTQIASLTKMMTASLVLEKVQDLNEVATVTRETLLLPGTVVGCPTSVFCNGNRMYVGEKVRVVDLLKATLMNSANDAATTLAAHVAGSPEKFVDMMNEKAKELGLADTHFCTPSGLEIDGEEDTCFSSAYDIARIASYSLQFEKIWEIMRIQEGTFYSADGKYMHNLKSTDLIMDSTPNYLGVKTGFTPLAGKSLLAGAVDATGKHRVIAILLNDEKRWEDMKLLTDWVFTNYNWQ